MAWTRAVTVTVVVLTAAACADTPIVAAGTSQASTTTAAGTMPPATAAVTTTATSATATTTTTRAPAPVGVDPDSPCLARAEFGDPALSDYVLPYPVGGDYYVAQSYCTSDSSHANQLAYDFSIPIGEVIVAARSGVVVDLREDSPDDGRGYGEHNFVMILHDDGTVGFYAYLQQDQVMVEIGDEVEASQPIALSGNSGQTGEAHLHFGVYRHWPPSEGAGVPVDFRNAAGPLDARGGLRVFRRCAAVPDPGLPAH